MVRNIGPASLAAGCQVPRSRGRAFFTSLGRPAKLVLLATLLIASGCAGGSQLQRCQADKDQLLAAIRDQRDSNRTLREQVASLEKRLDQSEKELASLGRADTRVSSRPPVEKAPLPWRAPDKPSK
ncbi:MAG: hypothetical protein SFU86_02805 [Pirellulaceae bacterium]|nr:hypothetical protein [Pirellulaceae bacterium]